MLASTRDPKPNNPLIIGQVDACSGEQESSLSSPSHGPPLCVGEKTKQIVCLLISISFQFFLKKSSGDLFLHRTKEGTKIGRT